MERYRDFHCNAELLCPNDSPEHGIHKLRAEEFIEAVGKQKLNVDYDHENNSLFIRWGSAPFKTSVGHEKYILDIGEDDSIIGIEVLEVGI